MSLIEVGIDAISIMDALFEMQGELTPELEAALDSVLARGEEALDAASAVVRRLSGEAETCSLEAKRYKDRAASLERQADALKGRMLFALDAAFNGKLKTARNTIYAQTTAPVTSIEVAADADLDRIWQTDSSLIRRTLALNKTEIKHRYDAGDPIPPEITVTELPGTRHLRIR